MGKPGFIILILFFSSVSGACFLFGTRDAPAIGATVLRTTSSA